MRSPQALLQGDPEIAGLINKELERQQSHLELIASENFASPAVMAAQGSVLTNKYAEGYPGRRYYGGCEYVDVAEALAIDRAKGYEVDRVNAARGETSRFLALLGEYKKAPEVTRARIYLESMRKVMGSVDDLTVLEQGSGVLPILDVNKLSGGGK